MGSQTLRKELSRKVVGDREFVENEIHVIDNFITEEELNTLYDNLGDDSVEAYSHGVSIDFDDSISMIDVQLLYDWTLEHIKELIDLEDDDEPCDKRLKMEALSRKLEIYLGFDIWIC